MKRHEDDGVRDTEYDSWEAYEQELKQLDGRTGLAFIPSPAEIRFRKRWYERLIRIWPDPVIELIFCNDWPSLEETVVLIEEFGYNETYEIIKDYQSEPRKIPENARGHRKT